MQQNAGLTLVEMLVALIIISVIFAAVASSLINFSQSSINSERRVQATSFANELHEGLQALPWDAAYQVSSDLDALAGVDGYSAGPPATFNGDLIVVDDDPDIAYAPVPVQVVDIPDIYDEVLQIVTWASRDNVPNQTIKRFTTVVRWSILGREVEARLESDRTATAQELGGTSPGSVELTFTPSPLVIENVNEDDPDEPDPDWRSKTKLTIDATFPNEWAAAVDDVKVSIPTDDPDAPIEIPLARLGTDSADPLSERVFRGELPAGAGPFEGPGTKSILLEWTRSTIPDSTFGQLIFALESEEDADAEAPTPVVTSVTLVTTVARVGSIDGAPNRLCNDVSLTAEVSNADPNVAIQATFNPDTGSDTRGMSHGTIGDGSTTYTLTLTRNSQVWDAPTGNSTNTDTFRVSVSGSDQTPIASQQLSIQQPAGTGNNRPCP